MGSGEAGLAPGAWGEVVAGAEGGLEVAGVGEAGAFGDLVEGEVGGEEEAFDVAEAEAEDFVFGGAAEGGFHAALEGAAGGVEGEAEVVDGEALVAALADEAGGASDEGVGDDEVVGGFAGDDLAGRNEDGRLTRRARRALRASYGCLSRFARLGIWDC